MRRSESADQSNEDVRKGVVTVMERQCEGWRCIADCEWQSIRALRVSWAPSDRSTGCSKPESVLMYTFWGESTCPTDPSVATN